MGKDLEFWKNRVTELEEECAEKQKEIDKLKSYRENLKSEITELKHILATKEEYQKQCSDVAPSREWLEDRHQSDCIEINQLRTALLVMVDELSKLRSMKGL